MTKNQPRLGKGLSALIAPRPAATRSAEEKTVTASQGVASIPLDRIRRNPNQPRRQFDERSVGSLAASIRSKGLLQPVLVRPLADGEYQLVAGERRWRAAQLAGLDRIPAIIRAATDAESIELALIENLQREDLNALERAEAYRQYLEAYGASVDELAVRVGESRPSVSNYLRLLNLNSSVQDLIRAGELGMGQARAIAGIEDPQAQLGLARLAVRRNLSVRQVEALAKQRVGVREEGARAGVERPKHLDDVERAFGRALGLAVQVKPGRGKNAGRIVIRYRSLEEFDRVAERLGASEYLE